MALKTHIIGVCQRLYQDFLLQIFLQLHALRLIDQLRAHMTHQFLIGAFHCNVISRRRCPCQILIGARSKVNHDKSRKQSGDTVDNVPHLPVFIFQQLSLPSRTDHESDDIDDKQPDQHDFQPDSHEILVPYHALRDILGKCLHEHEIIFREGHDADIVCPAAGAAYKDAFPAAFKNPFCLLRRILINHMIFHQRVDQIFLINISV